MDKPGLCGDSCARHSVDGVRINCAKGSQRERTFRHKGVFELFLITNCHPFILQKSLYLVWKARGAGCRSVRLWKLYARGPFACDRTGRCADCEELWKNQGGVNPKRCVFFYHPRHARNPGLPCLSSISTPRPVLRHRLRLVFFSRGLIKNVENLQGLSQTNKINELKYNDVHM